MWVSDSSAAQCGSWGLCVASRARLADVHWCTETLTDSKVQPWGVVPGEPTTGGGLPLHGHVWTRDAAENRNAQQCHCLWESWLMTDLWRCQVSLISSSPPSSWTRTTPLWPVCVCVLHAWFGNHSQKTPRASLFSPVSGFPPSARPGSRGPSLLISPRSDHSPLWAHGKSAGLIAAAAAGGVGTKSCPPPPFKLPPVVF